MDKSVNNRVFNDNEIVGFYVITIGLLSFVLLLGLFQGVLIVNLIISLIIFGFLFFGWPLSAELSADGHVTFKNPLRRVTVKPESLISVRAGGVHDYRAHIILRTRHSMPFAYRCRQFTNAPILAQAVLKLIDKAPQAEVDKDALKLLRHVAKGNTKPIPS